MTNLNSIGSTNEITAKLTRVADFLKREGITAIFTSLTEAGAADEHTSAEVSSLMDTWVLLRHRESAGDRRRLLYILKSRGMEHATNVREMRLSSKGIQLLEFATAASAAGQL